MGSVEKHEGRFLNEAYLRRTYLQRRMHVLAGKVANISVEDAVHCEDGCSALQRRLQRTAEAVLTLSLLFAIRWQTMIISELRRIIGRFWVAQAKKCILCTMYVRKKHNRSGSTSVVVVSKASGKYREIKSGSSEIWSDA